MNASILGAGQQVILEDLDLATDRSQGVEAAETGQAVQVDDRQRCIDGQQAGERDVTERVVRFQLENGTRVRP